MENFIFCAVWNFWYQSIPSRIAIQETITDLANFHSVMLHFMLYTSQPAITCSKLTIETLGQGVKYVQC